MVSGGQVPCSATHLHHGAQFVVRRRGQGRGWPSRAVRLRWLAADVGWRRSPHGARLAAGSSLPAIRFFVSSSGSQEPWSGNGTDWLVAQAQQADRSARPHVTDPEHGGPSVFEHHRSWRWHRGDLTAEGHLGRVQVRSRPRPSVRWRRIRDSYLLCALSWVCRTRPTTLSACS
jgi:hypothetical protein